ncbi:MAG TPA: hypothetical protein VGO70_11410 [Arsenicitalea sp.]|jgi:hypothetical protein|nr:hypothetical protein [Arsenicitalea sp.]
MGRTSVIARALGLDKSFLERGFGQAGKDTSDADDVLLPNFSAIKAAAHTDNGELKLASAPKPAIVAKGNTLIDAAIKKSVAELATKSIPAKADDAGKTDAAAAAADGAQAEHPETGDTKLEAAQPASAGPVEGDATEAQVAPAVEFNVAALFARLGAARALGGEPPKVDETKMVTLLAELDRIWSKSKAESGPPAA